MTATEVHIRLVKIFPEFENYWNSDDNLFRESDGGFTICGVFAKLSHFVRDHFPHLSPNALRELGQFLEECLAFAVTDEVYNAAACFLENLEGEDFTPQVAAHFGAKARGLLANSGR